jgi:glutaminyl-tRNA synthetase
VSETKHHFIHDRVTADNASKHYDGRVVTRFPPEPNGYPHIGHAKSICLNFGLARDFGGVCHLRMDDTNPTTEDIEYVEAIKRDVKWLGFDWGDKMFYASDYFGRLYEIAQRFIREGKAYVDSLNEEQISEYRGTVNQVGRPSPDRDRSVEENLRLFEGMRTGEFADGTYVLRAKGDLSNPNMKMRDPLMYRIRRVHHYRTADAWNIYPFYDYAHCFSDAFEGITHSICTLEFANNRELYDWYLAQVAWPQAPQQIEFARLALDYTVVSKRKLLRLVKEGHVTGWDDPRMPTLSALRRRGYTPEAIRHFCELIGVAKANSTVDVGKLEFCVREDLNVRSRRVMCVLKPLKVVIDNWAVDKVHSVDAPYFPSEFEQAGSRSLPLSKELYIDHDDFMENPPKGFHRLQPGGEVRLRYGCVIKCNEVKKDAAGHVTELRCTYDEQSFGGGTSDGRKVKGVIHWVPAKESIVAEVRLYDRLFKDPRPDDADDFMTCLNPNSLQTVKGARVEPSLVSAKSGEFFQFERVGFFCVDVESKDAQLVFNRTVTLKDSWAEAPAAAVAKPEASKTAAKPSAKPTTGKPHVDAPSDPALLQQAQALQARGVDADDSYLLSQSEAMAKFTLSAVGPSGNISPVLLGWLTNELQAVLKGQEVSSLRCSGQDIAALVAAIERSDVSHSSAKKVFEVMVRDGGAPMDLVNKMGLLQNNDVGAVTAWGEQVLKAFPEQTARYRQGEVKMFGFLVGQVLKASGGKANPQLTNDTLKKLLG